MSMFKNTSGRRVLSWILTLTMIFSQFFGTSASLTAFAAPGNEQHTASHNVAFEVSYGSEDAVSSASVKASCSDDCAANDRILTLSVEKSIQYDGSEHGVSGVGIEDWVTSVSAGTVITYKKQNGDSWDDSAETPKDAGTYRALCKYYGDDEIYVEYTITPISIEGLELTLSQNSADYDGDIKAISVNKVGNLAFDSEIFDVTVSQNGVNVDAANRKNAGDYVVSVTGKESGNYAGKSAEEVFTINKRSLVTASVSINGAIEFSYNGSLVGPEANKVIVKDGDNVIDPENYTVSGNKGTNTGDYFITVTGTGNYTGVATEKAPWKIILSDMVVDAPNVVVSYNKAAHGISVNVTTPASGAVVKFKDDQGQYTLNESPKITNVSESGKVVYFEINANGYKTYYGQATISINKTTKDTPADPVATTQTTNSITLKSITDGEYAINDGPWQNSNVFEGLSANTAYKFSQRVKGDDNYNPSASTNATISTRPHVHSWSYEADGNTIIATCSDTDKGHGGNSKSVSLSFNASQNNIVYEKDVERTVSWDAATAEYISVSVSSITYQKKDGSNWVACGKPVDAGEYKATVTVRVYNSSETKTASVEYSIGKTDITDITGHIPESVNDLVYDNTMKALVTIAEGKPEGAKEIRYAVNTSNVTPNVSDFVSGNSAVSKNAAATYYVWYIWVGDENHNDTKAASVKAIISPKPVIVKAISANKTYRDEEPSLKAKAEGTVPGVDLVCSATREKGENVGTYSINPNYESNSNYAVTLVPAVFTITRKTISVDGIAVKNKNVKEYDGTDTATFDYSGINIYDEYGKRINATLADDDVTVSANGAFESKTISENKRVDINSYDLNGDKARNYLVSYNASQKTVSAAIVKRAITVSANDQTIEAGKHIDQNAYTITNKAEGHNVVVELTVSGNEGIENTADSDGWIVPVVTSITDEHGSVSENYEVTTVSGQLHVTKVKVGIQKKPEAKTPGYKGVKQELIKPGVASDNATMVYYLSEDGELPENADFKPDIPMAKDAGTYTVYYKAIPTTNDNIASDIDKVVVVMEKADLLVIAQDNTIEYGEAPKSNSVSYNGLEGDDNGDVIADIDNLVFSYTYEQYGDCGEYVIQVTGTKTSDNYNIGHRFGKLTVVPKEVGLTWSNTKLTYTGSLQVPTASANGTVSNDVVTVDVKLVEGTDGTTVGKHTASANALSNPNYILPEDNTIEYEIEKATASLNVVPVASANMVYNRTEQILVSVNGVTNDGYLRYALGEDGTNVPTTGWTPYAPSATDAGTYYVWYKVEGYDNYDDMPAKCISADIAQKPATVSVNAGQEKTYGDDDPVLTASVNGVIFPDELDYTLVRVAGEKKGIYTINVELGINPNYDVKTTNSTFTIKKRIVSVNGITTADKEYDGTDVAELNFDNVLFKNIYGEDTLTVTAKGSFGGSNVSDNYTVVITDMKLDGPSVGNYSLDPNSQTVITGKKITQRPLTIKANDQTVSKNDPLTVGIGDVDLVDGTTLADGDALVAISYNSAQTTSTNKVTEIGIIVLDESTVRIKNAKDVDVTANYDITLDTGNLTVLAPIATYKTEPKAKTSLSYNGRLQELAEEGETDEGTIYYSLYPDKDFKTVPPSKQDVGSYPVYYYIQASNDNFRNSEVKEVSQNAVISKADLTISANAHKIIYGQAPANNGVTYDKFLGNDKVTSLGGELTYSYDYVQYGNVGTYKITPGGYTSDNYNLIYVPGTLTVEQKEVGITWGEQTLTYTGKPQAPEATATDTVNNDIVSVNVTGQAVEVGDDYTATADSLENENYKLPATKPQTKFKIQKADNPLEVEPTAKEDLVYNGKDQELVEPGKVTASKLLYYTTDRENDIPELDDFSEAVPTGKDAGDYYVWYMVPGIENSSASINATRVSENAIRIKKAVLTIKPVDQTITYGETPAPYTVSFDGIQTGDTVNSLGLSAYTASCNYAISDGAGEFTISVNVAGSENQENYVIATPDGKLTVNRKVVDLAWTPDPAEFDYDGQSHVPAATVTNKVGNDVVNVTVTGAKVNVSDNYVATATALSNKNYELPAENTIIFKIKKVDSELNKEPEVISGLTYNGTALTLVTAGTATGGDLEYAVSEYDNVAPTEGWSTTVPSETNAGTYCVWRRVNGHGNYSDIAPLCVGKVKIAQAQLIVTAESLEVPYGTTRAELDIKFSLKSITGFVGNDDVSSIGGMGLLKYECDYEVYGNEARYSVTPYGFDDERNYKITYFPGYLTVVQRTVTLSWNNLSFVYDGQSHIPTVVVGNILPEDQGKIKVVVEGAQTEAGTYLATATEVLYVKDGTETTAVNYKLPETGSTKQFVIAKADISANKITEPEAKADLVYNGAAQELLEAGSVSDNLGTFKYALAASENTAEEDLIFGDEIPTGKDAGTYYVWYMVSANTTNYNDVAAKKVSATIDSAVVTISYNANGGAGTKASESFELSCSTDMVTVSDNTFTYEGYEFVSWNTAADGSGTTYAEGETFVPETVEDFTLYAQWKLRTYSVSFNMNGYGEQIESQEVVSGDTVTEPPAPTEEGFEFGGWFTEAECSTSYNFATPVSADIVLYAKWTEKFTVSFNMNGNGEQIASKTVLSGNTVDEPDAPVADGFEFGGWFTEAECSTSYNFATPVSADIVLYAKWTEKFTVSFNMNGHGAQIASKEVVSGDTVTRPATPSANGFAFGGWFTESELTNEYDFATPVSADIVLYAKWTEKFTVSFNMSGHGTQIASQVVVSGDKASRPTDPTDPEYTFENWFTAEDFATVYDFDAAVSANITVYAKWNLTISLNSISINKAPAKTVYTEGEVFDPAGMEVVANYSDGSSKTVSGYTITPSANLTTSDNKITVSYTEKGITATADVAIKVKAKEAANDIVEDEEYSSWNIYEDASEHEFKVSGVNVSGDAIDNSNTNSKAYYDATLKGDTITVSVKSVGKDAVKEKNTVLEFVTDDGVVEYTLPVEYKKPQLKLSTATVTVKNGVDTVVQTTILRKSSSGALEPMDLTGAKVTFNGNEAEIMDAGVIGITASGKVSGKINVVGEGWNEADPVALKFNIKGSDKDVLTVEMGTTKKIIVNSNAKGQTFEFPIFYNGEAADEVTIVDKKNTGLVKVESGTLTVAYPAEGTLKKGNYTITLTKGTAKTSIKVKVSDKALSEAIALKVQSKYDVVTKQKMVLVPNFKDMSGTITDVSVENADFTAELNEAGNIVVDYEGAAYNAKNLNIGTMTFKLTVDGVEDEISVVVNKVKAKKTAVKVKGTKVALKAGATGIANLVCTYTDAAKKQHLVAPLSIAVEGKKVTAKFDENDPTVIYISNLTGKSGSVKATLTFPGGVTKKVTIKVKEAK